MHQGRYMSIQFPFNPLERAVEVESQVMKEGKRLYYRFRPAKFYGGVATADAVGCSFLCAYCWNYKRNLNPGKYKDFYSPQEVVARMLAIAQKNFLNLFRLSGAEPILGDRSFEHLIEIIKILFRYRPGSPFILETNGFFLGYKPELIELFKYLNIKVRVSLKGIDEISFENISGVEKKYFEYPLIALRELEERKVIAWPALMGDFFPHEEVLGFEEFLKDNYTSARIEIENLKPFPFVVENMKKRNLEL